MNGISKTQSRENWTSRAAPRSDRLVTPFQRNPTFASELNPLLLRTDEPTRALNFSRKRAWTLRGNTYWLGLTEFAANMANTAPRVAPRVVGCRLYQS